MWRKLCSKSLFSCKQIAGALQHQLIVTFSKAFYPVIKTLFACHRTFIITDWSFRFAERLVRGVLNHRSLHGDLHGSPPRSSIEPPWSSMSLHGGFHGVPDNVGGPSYDSVRCFEIV